MTIQFPPSFTLLDGTAIPRIAWGNGTGLANTTQLYKTEKEIGETIAKSALDSEDVYVTSKLTQ
ncbi:hypothetical protein GALMADRAFT_141689 [Galerina marginata CBS 339.88]|uniref:NADP-dependent oxidoreductase domain-containing protein n=1 Tax=Galerina marginata (strain CBS 339.88) TaxID=685588 RepID=A0A067SSQ5_GALM3|nr:hypothetical protein GALMADRAFT_141689 [Galerina marginata CBS 339.88]